MSSEPVQNESSENLQNNATDYMIAIGRATVGLVPVVGNVLSEALTVSIPRQRMDRLAHFAAEVPRRLGHLEEQDLRRRVERHLPLIEEGFLKAVRAATAERRCRIASLVANGIAKMAKAESDYTADNFLQWSVKEQLEEVASMGQLLRVVQRAGEGNLLRVEEFLAREKDSRFALSKEE